MAVGVKATLYTQTFSVPLYSGVNATLNFAKFDTSSGYILNSVQLELGLLVTGANVQVDNDGGSTASGSTSVTVTKSSFSFTGGSTALSGIGTLTAVGNTFSGLVSSSTINLGITSGDTVGVFNNTGAGDYSSWNAPDLILDTGDNGDGTYSPITMNNKSSYQASGGGTITTTLNAVIGSGTSFSGGSVYYQGNTPSATFYGTLIYDVVPEPGTWISASMLLVFVGGSVGRSYWCRAKAAKA